MMRCDIARKVRSASTYCKAEVKLPVSGRCPPSTGDFSSHLWGDRHEVFSNFTVPCWSVDGENFGINFRSPEIFTAVISACRRSKN